MQRFLQLKLGLGPTQTLAPKSCSQQGRGEQGLAPLAPPCQQNRAEHGCRDRHLPSPHNAMYRCPNVNAEQMGASKAAFHAGAGRADSNKSTIVRQKFLETDAAKSELQRQLWSGGSAGRRLCSLWINVLLLHYSLSFKGLPGNLSLLSIE